jgi:hypothetical protein
LNDTLRASFREWQGLALTRTRMIWVLGGN